MAVTCSAINAEAEAVRYGVGVYDGSPLGKFDISGRGVTAFIDLLYTNDFADLEIGMGRYGIMLSDDGMILDDGVTFKLAENHYLMSTSTGFADLVFRHMEYFVAGRVSELASLDHTSHPQCAMQLFADLRRVTFWKRLAPN